MRLFIGIEPSEDTRNALGETIDSLSALFSGRFVRRDMLHLTLAFIGETDASGVDRIIQTMDGFANHVCPFDIALGNAGYFGNPEKAILYCGVQDNPVLEQTALFLQESLQNNGIPFDPKPFNAHITLARKFDAGNISKGVNMPRSAFRAEHATLFHSHRVNDILVYEPIHHSLFSGGKKK